MPLPPPPPNPEDDPGFPHHVPEYLINVPVALPPADPRPHRPSRDREPITRTDLLTVALATLCGAGAAVLVWMIFAVAHDYPLLPSPAAPPAPAPTTQPAQPTAPVPADLFRR